MDSPSKFFRGILDESNYHAYNDMSIMSTIKRRSAMSMFKRLQLGRLIDAKLIIAVMAGVIAAGGLLFVGRVAFGTIPDASGDIQACVTNKAGRIRLIDTDAGETCNAAETALSWNQGTPSGGVMFYDGACPAGWTEFEAARGRTIVALPDGGTLNGTVGSALTDTENRAHAHTVDPLNTASSFSGSHNHSVDPPVTATVNAGFHTHEWAFLDALERWRTFSGSPGQTFTMIDWGDGIDSEGSGIFPIARVGTSSFTRSHFTDFSGLHFHNVDIGSFSSGSAGSHNHGVDIALTGSSIALTSQVMPYIQLRACEKD